MRCGFDSAINALSFHLCPCLIHGISKNFGFLLCSKEAADVAVASRVPDSPRLGGMDFFDYELHYFSSKAVIVMGLDINTYYGGLVYRHALLGAETTPFLLSLWSQGFHFLK